MSIVDNANKIENGLKRFLEEEIGISIASTTTLSEKTHCGGKGSDKLMAIAYEYLPDKGRHNFWEMFLNGEHIVKNDKMNVEYKVPEKYFN
jgi:hypothetical protein